MTSSAMPLLLLLLVATSVRAAVIQGPVPAQLLRAGPPSIQYNADCVVDQLYEGLSCDTFFMCMEGRTSNHQLVLFSCGQGTMFDSKRLVCVRAQPSRCPNGPDRIAEETDNSSIPRPTSEGTSSPLITTSTVSLPSTSKPSPSTPSPTASNSGPSPSTLIPISSTNTPSPSIPSATASNSSSSSSTPSPTTSITSPSPSTLIPTSSTSTPSPPSPAPSPPSPTPSPPSPTPSPPSPTPSPSSPTASPSTPSPPSPTSNPNTPSPSGPSNRPSTPSPPSPTTRPSPPSPPSPPGPSPFGPGSRPPSPPGFQPPKPSPPTGAVPSFKPTVPSKPSPPTGAVPSFKPTVPSKPSKPTTTQKPKKTKRPGGFLASIFKPLISRPFLGLDDPEPQGSSTCPQYSLDPTSLFDCDREGRWEHPGDCNRFYQCIHTMDCILKGFVFRCPDNFHFVKSSGSCEALLRPTPCHKFSDASASSFTYPVIQLEEESINQFQQASAYWDYMPFLMDQS